MELLSFPGITEDEENRISAFLSKREIIPIDGAIERLAIMFRRKTGRKLPDSIIAATAITLGAILVTNDKHLLELPFPGLATVSAAGVFKQCLSILWGVGLLVTNGDWHL